MTYNTVLLMQRTPNQSQFDYNETKTLNVIGKGFTNSNLVTIIKFNMPIWSFVRTSQSSFRRAPAASATTFQLVLAA